MQMAGTGAALRTKAHGSVLSVSPSAPLHKRFAMHCIPLGEIHQLLFAEFHVSDTTTDPAGAPI